MDGIINVLKPPGMSSNHVIGYIRRLTGEKRVGHAGTLDPQAAGVLPVFVGRATRLAEYVLAEEKTYIGEICFGAETDTQDAQGKVLACDDTVVSFETAETLLKSMEGEIDQIPPSYSALKRDGQPLYKLARKGIEVEREARRITIFSADLLAQTAPNRFLFRVHCSKGTYIRTLCHDLGRMAGTYAHLAFLLRVQTGQFTIDRAWTLEELAEKLPQALQPMEIAISHLPQLHIEKKWLKMAINGVVLPPQSYRYDGTDATPVVVYCDAQMIGLYTITEEGAKPYKILLGGADA